MERHRVYRGVQLSPYNVFARAKAAPLNQAFFSVVHDSLLNQGVAVRWVLRVFEQFSDYVNRYISRDGVVHRLGVAVAVNRCAGRVALVANAKRHSTPNGLGD